MLRCKVQQRGRARSGPAWTGARGARYGSGVKEIMTLAGPAYVLVEQPEDGAPSWAIVPPPTGLPTSSWCSRSCANSRAL